jgi:hypothetical protein
MAAPSKDAMIRIAYGELYVQMVAEGHAGNPDVLDDMTRRAIDAFRQAAQAVVETGIMDVDVEEEE